MESIKQDNLMTNPGSTHFTKLGKINRIQFGGKAPKLFGINDVSRQRVPVGDNTIRIKVK